MSPEERQTWRAFFDVVDTRRVGAIRHRDVIAVVEGAGNTLRRKQTEVRRLCSGG